MTVAEPLPRCALCSRLAAEMVDPPRRTLGRGEDPSDPSYSVIVILPDVPLCAEHSGEVRNGTMRVGWCDHESCRIYGPLGEPSACGDLYTALAAANKPHRN